MLRVAAVVFSCAFFGAGARRARSFLRDVPDGMCFKCEVNCIRDCTEKFENEVMKDDAFVQLDGKPASDDAKMPMQIANQFVKQFQAASKIDCGKQRGCSIANQCVKSVESEFKALGEQEAQQNAVHELDLGHEIEVTDHKQWTNVASQQVTIADFPTFHKPHSASGAGVSERDLKRLDSSHEGSQGVFNGHLRLQQTGLAPTGEAKLPYPLHPVKRGVFFKGQQTLAQCMQYCFAATCGCQDSPMTGTVSKTQELVKAANAGGFHLDTPPVWRYEKATKKQCGAGVSKVIEGLYVIFFAAKGGTQEVCKEGMFKLMAGTSGALGLTDPKEDMYKCDCGVNRLDCNEPKFGCSWNKKNSRCEFGAMHNTICYARYKTDKTL